MRHMRLKMSPFWYDRFVIAADISLHPKIVKRRRPWSLYITVQWDGSAAKIQKIRDWFIDGSIDFENIKIWTDPS